MHNEENKTIRFIAFNLFVLFVFLYLLSASVLNFYHIDAGQLQIEVVKAIIERSDLSVPKGIGIRGVDGRDYSWAGIGSALLAVPFYIAGKLMGAPPENIVSVMNQLFGAATVVLVFIFCVALGYSRRTSLITAIFYGLGTMAWPLAKQPFDHVIETFFILLSVYFMYLYSIDEKVSHLLYSAISVGFAFITRSYSVLIIPPLFILMILYSSKQPDFKASIGLMARDVVLFSLVFLPFISLSLWYNHYRFGSIFETGYLLMANRLGIDFFTGTPLLTGLSGFLINPGKGFFYYSPVGILFFFSIKSFIKKYPKLGISFIFIMLSYLFFISKNIYWHGDWAWGPRYLLLITPFLVIPIAELFESDIRLKKNPLKAFVYSIIAVSLLIQIAAVSVDFQKYFINLRFEENVKFTEAFGDGVQPIIEPTAETYFNWHKSPILTQFRFIYKIAGGIKDYRYSKPPEDAIFTEKIKIDLCMNVFDFWWLYKYFLDGSYSGFMGALLLLLAAIYSASRLRKAVI